ncbi:hypothetical protein H8D30_02335 [bacterium]|nr:hypothetical protein [bacterium]
MNLYERKPCSPPRDSGMNRYSLDNLPFVNPKSAFWGDLGGEMLLSSDQIKKKS